MLSSTGHDTSSSDNGLPQEVPLQQIEYQGAIYWVAVRNYEYFEFLDIDKFEADLVSSSYADSIREMQDIELYVDPNFSSKESVFILEKALKGIRIRYEKSYDPRCSANKLYVSNEEVFGDCLSYFVPEGEAYNKTESLVYHLIKQ